MEKMQEVTGGNAEIKNVYFGFENYFPTKVKNKNNSEILPKNRKKSKKSKSKSKTKKTKKEKENENEKIKRNTINEFNQIKIIKNNDLETNNNKYFVKGSKYAKKPVKIIKTDEEKEKEYFEEKIKNKNKSKKKSKSKSKNKIKKKIEEEDLVETEENKSKNKSKSKNKEKRKNKTKKSVDEEDLVEKEENKSKSKSKSKNKEKNKSKKKQKSKNKKSKEKNKKENKSVIVNKNENINNEENIYIPEYNEIKDEAMNDVNKHIHNLNLAFNNNIINQNKTNNNIKIGKNNQLNKIKTNYINKNNNNNIINLNYEDETLYKRPYTAHAYKVKSKSKTKRLTKTIRSKDIDEEEKIMAFKEKVLVYDKILSLYNAPKIKQENNIEDKFSKTHKQRMNSAFNLNKTKNNNSKHYMKPRERDIKKSKKKEIIYYNDKPEEDIEGKKYEKEESEIKKENNKVIKIINTNNKVYNKSQQILHDLKDILTKDNMNAFMNNFMLKNNFNLQDMKNGEESKINNTYKNIKFYHGGKNYRKPKIKLIHNNSDTNLEKNKRYKLFNPKEIISNPNNKFNFFSQTFTKQPIYGKYYNPPEVESTINNNLSYITSNQWNGRYKIKKYISVEKENPNDVYNYDYKYDDLNTDSDNELPSTNFKARTIPKYNKVDIEYKDYKSGKLVGGKYKIKVENEKYQDNGGLDKNIYHPFLIDENM